MSIEGRLTIDLDRSAIGAARARIASSRPVGVTRALVGSTAEDVVRTIPLLFNVCGVAQGAAAVEACERAIGIGVSRTTRQVRKALVLVEMLREHLIRAVMDWRRFLGLEPAPESMLRVMRLFTMARRALDPDALAFTIGADLAAGAGALQPTLTEAEGLLSDLVYAEPAHQWHERRTLGELENWGGAGGTPAQQLVELVIARGWAGVGDTSVDFLSGLPEHEIAARLLGAESAAFVAAPMWDGTPRETSVLSRQAEQPLVQDVIRVHGAGLLARLTARLVEMAALPRALSCQLEADNAEPQPQSCLPEGRGVAHVEAARGRLVHGVEIANNVVSRYAILAPTEWNFHSSGAAARGLADIAGREEDVQTLASLFVSAVDPCVGFEVRVH